MRRLKLGPFVGMAWVALVAGCGRSDSIPVPTSAPAAGSSNHTHLPPHGGTAVELGPDQYHLELVHDAGSEQLTAYVLDGEMEKFIRISQSRFQIRVAGSLTGPLEFQAVERPATGERVGETSEFAAAAPWLKTNTAFDGVLTEIKIGGQTYRDISFKYPKGNE